MESLSSRAASHGHTACTCTAHSHSPSTSTTSLHTPHRTPRTHRRAAGQAPRALFDPPPFCPDKLTVTYCDTDSVANQESGLHRSRRYTLTHNDVSGALQLSVGVDYNHSQISGFYTRLLRDEVTAEFRDHEGQDFGSDNQTPSLHVFCHVSGEERWLAPPLLRNYIFRREMPLVLDTFVYADRDWLDARPELANAEIVVHFQSNQTDLDTVELWGILGQRSSWKPVPISLIKRCLLGLLGIPGMPGVPGIRGMYSQAAPQRSSQLDLGQLRQPTSNAQGRPLPPGTSGGPQGIPQQVEAVVPSTSSPYLSSLPSLAALGITAADSSGAAAEEASQQDTGTKGQRGVPQHLSVVMLTPHGLRRNGATGLLSRVEADTLAYTTAAVHRRQQVHR